MTIGLCLLVYNELEGCRLSIPHIMPDQFDEVFAVDGGSTDGTIEFLRTAGIEVRIQPRKGYNAAYIYAFETTSCEALIFFHPKGTIPPSQTLLFRNYFSLGYELIIASRIMKGAVNEEDKHLLKPRKWFVVSLGVLVALIWKKEGNFVGDVLHGFRGMTKSAFLAIEPLDKGLSIDLEMAVRSYRKKLKRIEFPVHERSRQFGETHFRPIPTAIGIFKYLWFELKRKG